MKKIYLFLILYFIVFFLSGVIFYSNRITSNSEQFTFNADEKYLIGVSGFDLFSPESYSRFLLLVVNPRESIFDLRLSEEPEDGWCCKDGEIIECNAEECRHRGGKFFRTRKEVDDFCWKIREEPQTENPKPEIHEEGWCCKDGEIISCHIQECIERKGRFFHNREEAEEHCRQRRGSPPDERPLPEMQEEIWCCRNGEIFPSYPDECRDHGGRFFQTREDAEKHCLPENERFYEVETNQWKGWCCENGKLHKITSEECDKKKGRYFSLKKQAQKCCCEGDIPDEEKNSRLHDGTPVINEIKSILAVKTIVPPADIDSAPFDTAVLPDGSPVVSGTQGYLLVLKDEKKKIFENTRYKFLGRYFECDKNGNMWYWNCPKGRLIQYDTSQKIKLVDYELQITQSNGSLAVNPDGSEVFVGWWNDETGKSAVYRYDTKKKTHKIIYEGTSYKDRVHALEVTNSGELYMASRKGIFKYDSIRWKKYVNLHPNFIVNHDALTSDPRGNLFFSSIGKVKGIFRIRTVKSGIESLIKVDKKTQVPSGLTWNNKRKYLTGARKQKGEFIKIYEINSRSWGIKVLNKATGLIRPIAIEEGPEGDIYVNGDEVGLLKISRAGKVSIYKNEICSFQPPAADFAFRNKLIFYSWAAPGFVSQIVTIPDQESYSVFAKRIGSPAGIDVSPENIVYFCSFSKNGGVYKLNSNGKSTQVISNIPYALGLVIDCNNHFWVGAAEIDAVPDKGALNDVLSTRLLHYDSQGKLVKEVVRTDTGQFGNNKFTFFDVDKNGENIYLPVKNKIFKLDKNGKIVSKHSGNYNALRGAKLFSDGYLYFVDYWASALYRIKI